MYGQMGYPGYTGMPFNPMVNAQQRLAQMEQQYPQFAQGQPQQQQPGWMKCRAVTSMDEAKAAMIDLDGSLNVFTNTANGEIYTKQVGMDGLAVFNTYRRVDQPQQAQAQQAMSQQQGVPTPSETGVQRTEFVQAINALQMQINALQGRFESEDGGINVQPDASNATGGKTTGSGSGAANGRSVRK